MKVSLAEQIAEQVRTWQQSGEKVVFTNGCFDLLHVGHVRYLTAARALGDRLVVGLNTDASVRKLKGSERPILPEQERAELIAALRCVDAVVLFEEDTACQLLRQLQPDIYAKGGDYQRQILPEAITVQEIGSRLAILPFVAGYSTTRLIERIGNNKGNCSSTA
ncbi:MAG: D-glycero-beta-D-manno-heptose 1-phosphate adenylyltransferase [Cyanobacteria bacterium NC_groundwater_1444_Ag_S-0.65um_54_12]|nr:D-glycero-beta-D-manno-heptose 1-phosphate adenylyltransferase [Cyanobacteria bacterium NC_groundwater_1444_Ag_S-0.65um_54_12]